jgi:GntR family transcriptional regulator / MocR family aminotransferase
VVVCPAQLLGPIVDEKRVEDRGSPALEQLTLATLIKSGRFDKHLRGMRALYGARRRAHIDALAEHAPQVRLTGLAAGIHAVGRPPEGVDEHAVVMRARERSVGLYGMSRYRADGETRPPQLALGLGDLSEGAIRRGIATVADLLRPMHNAAGLACKCLEADGGVRPHDMCPS